jgi:hypothetical protein
MPAGMRRKTYERLKMEDLKLITPYLREEILKAASVARRTSRSPMPKQ